MNKEPILGFQGEYRFLSNFVPCEITLDGQLYGSTEAAYQAAKTLDLSERKRFIGISPGKAKRLGRTVSIRSDWDDVKEKVMYDLLRQKFMLNVSYRELLLETEDRPIEERNTWGDVVWGTIAPGVGRNLLGILLMKIRSELQMFDV